MISHLYGFVLALSDSLAASIIAKATIVVVFGLVVTYLARRDRAAVRHVVLAAMFAVLLCLPVVSIITPPIRIAVPVVARSIKTLPPPAGDIDSIPSLPASEGRSATPPVITRPSRPSLSALLVIGWLVGVALSLISLGVGLWKIRRLRRSGLPWAHGQVLVSKLALENRIIRHVSLMLHEALPGPIASGVLHPVILLPVHAQTWDSEELNRALVHELEHVRRADSLINCLARAVCAVYWFHPLVWMAWHQLVLEAERSCDDVVLGSFSDATAYADQLVGLARRLSLSSKAQQPAMANRRDLAIRVGAVLDSRQRRGRAGSLLVSLGCVAFALTVITMSPLRIVSATQPQSSQGATGRAPRMAVSTTLPAFKSVSVRRSQGENSYRGVTPHGITFIDLPPEEIIEIAYGHDFGNFGFQDLRNDRLVGGPSWARNWLGPKGLNYEGYDIVAKTDESTARKFGEDSNDHNFWSGRCPYRDEMMLMLQSLLTDRFKLKVRHKTRQLPIYALVVAPGGPKFLHAPSFKSPMPPCPAEMRCFQRYTSMALLAYYFAASVDRPVVDQTGLKGGYYIKLEWPKKPSLAGTHIAPHFGSVAFMFTAIEQQLGLKLKPTQGPVDFLVIDHMERPSMN